MRSSLSDAQRITEKQKQIHLDQDRTFVSPPPHVPFAQNSSDYARNNYAQKQPYSRLVPREGWSPLLLLAIALYCVVFAINYAHWIDYSANLYWSPALGLLIGFMVAKVSHVPQTLLHLCACVIGHLFSVWITSSLAFNVPASYVFQYLISAFSGQLNSQPPEASQVIFFFYLSFLCFFLGYFGSWLVYRASLAWLVAFVYCSIMLVDLNYVTVTEGAYLDFYVVLMLGSLLVLIARVQLAMMITGWVREGLYTDSTWLRKITTRCMQVACLITLLALPISWLLPVVNQPSNGKVFWNTMDTGWNDLLNGRLSLKDLRSLGATGSEATNYFGNHLLVTSSVSLPGGDVLTYQSSDKQGHYLESVSYDQFDGHGWSSSNAQTLHFSADAPLALDTMMPGKDVTTHVRITTAINGSNNYVFLPAMPRQISLPLNETYLGTTDASGALTTASWATNAQLKANSSYVVISTLPQMDAASLTMVPLPEKDSSYWKADPYYYWLNTMYMQLPHDFSPTVQKMVTQWTQNSRTTYDALRAIEAHLSDSSVFTYSTDNVAIPDKTDVVDWLLQTKSGYCTYYATAMAVMGRMLHIPTRVMSGFSSGTYNQTSGNWIVQGSDAHSWVQAYFPSYGWVDFDPTPGYSTHASTTTKPAATAKATQPTPVATATPHSAPAKRTPSQPQNPTDNGSAHNLSSTLSPLVWWGGVSFFTLVLIIGAALLLQERRRKLPFSTAGLYLRIGRIASWAGLGPRSWQTPYEYSNMLSRHLSRQDPLLWHVTNTFVRERWGLPGLDKRQEILTNDAAARWPSLRLALLRLVILKRAWSIKIRHKRK